MDPRSRILAIDDNEIIIDVIRETLEDEYDLVTASSPREGLDILFRMRPDLVLLDVEMPGITGYEVCRRIRANPRVRHTKVILVSGKAKTEERLAGYDVGADDYITKPFDPDELAAKVRVFIRLKSMEEVDCLKSQLLDLVSHEIRTPLTGITPAAEMLMAEGDMSEDERREWGDMIYQNSRRLLRLTEKGMLLCQFEAGEVDLKFTDLDLVDLANATIEDMHARARARARHITLTVVETGPVNVRGEARFLRMAFAEVLDNALKYCREESEVIVQLDGGDRGRFSVTNTGTGIESDDLEHIFDSFTTRRIGGQVVGSGLSTALARVILRAHGGDMDVESEPGRETTFRAWLPSEAEVPAQPSAP